MAFLRDEIRSPLGVITCVAKDGALVALDFEGNDARLRGYLARRFGAEAKGAARGTFAGTRAIEAYSEGEMAALDDVAIALAATPYELAVYEELRRIPRGEVVSYSELARRVGRPEAARAVGAANGRNPISIVVPCHRVIGAHGALTGYAGGLDRKRWLLEHEKAHTSAGSASASASGAGSRPDRSPRGSARSRGRGEPRCSA